MMASYSAILAHRIPFEGNSDPGVSE